MEGRNGLWRNGERDRGGRSPGGDSQIKQTGVIETAENIREGGGGGGFKKIRKGDI